MRGESKEYIENQRRNLAEIEELKNKIKHKEIREFHEKHLGSSKHGDDGPASFIPKESFYRDNHDAVFSLLLFLDQYGEVRIPVGKSDQTTTLREHNLRVTEILIRSLNIKWMSSYNLLPAGMAALSFNIGLGLGSKYCEQFSKNKEMGQVSIGQASLAILEQIPEVNSLYYFEKTQEIIKFFSLCVDTSINSPKFPFEKENTSWNIAKILAAAELRVRREEIFRIAEKPEGFWSVDEETKEKKAEAAAGIAQQAESERQQLDISKFNRKAYLDELTGLRNSLNQLKQLKPEIKIKNKIIAAQKKVIDALENKEVKALKQGRKELENAEFKLKVFLTTINPDEGKGETSAQGEGPGYETDSKTVHTTGD